MAASKNYLTIETLAKFERDVNLDPGPYDINLMVMPGTLEDKHKNLDRIPALRRQFNLIYLLVSGEHDVKLGVDHRQLEPNSLVIVPESTLYASDHIRNCKGYCIHFKTEFLQTLLPHSIYEEFPFLHFDSDHILNISNEQSRVIQQVFKDIIREFDRFSPEKDHILRNYILILLLRIREIYNTHAKEPGKKSSRAETIAVKFKHLVEKEFIRMRTVSAYADKLNISSSHLSDIVKETFGRSPLDMIHSMILLEAKVLLRSTEKTISEISHILQFEDQAHFSHFIKKHTGSSPQALRKIL